MLTSLLRDLSQPKRTNAALYPLSVRDATSLRGERR